jgi:S-adenosylmethionine:tRNA ribosyltransferase-isomerase
LQHGIFRDVPKLLRAGDLLVVNRSRVLPARIVARRANGGPAEIFLLRPREPGVWESFIRPGRRLREGDSVETAEGLRLTILSGPKGADGRRDVRFECDPAEVPVWLHKIGQTPLPPYIHRAPAAQDRERYQTVYASESGSVAAPTAGLHFTPGLLDTLKAIGIEIAEVVLHVGPGTFRPVQVENVHEHRVAPEPFVIPEATAAAVAKTRQRGGRIVAVGTTTVRTLESAAETGGLVRPGGGETDLVIVPGYRFQVIDALITNFHLPRSSLLLLVCALAGRERILSAYQEAIGSGYRFYSYGDAMLILPSLP